MGSHSRSHINYNDTRADYGASRLNATVPPSRARPQTAGSPDAGVANFYGNVSNLASWTDDSYLRTQGAIRQTPPGPTMAAQPQHSPSYTSTVTEKETLEETGAANAFSPVKEQRSVVNISSGGSPSQSVIVRTVKETVTSNPNSPVRQVSPQITPASRQGSPRSPSTQQRMSPSFRQDLFGASDLQQSQRDVMVGASPQRQQTSFRPSPQQQQASFKPSPQQQWASFKRSPQRRSPQQQQTSFKSSPQGQFNPFGSFGARTTPSSFQQQGSSPQSEFSLEFQQGGSPPKLQHQQTSFRSPGGQQQSFGSSTQERFNPFSSFGAGATPPPYQHQSDQSEFSLLFQQGGSPPKLQHQQTSFRSPGGQQTSFGSFAQEQFNPFSSFGAGATPPPYQHQSDQSEFSLLFQQGGSPQKLQRDVMVGASPQRQQTSFRPSPQQQQSSFRPSPQQQQTSFKSSPQEQFNPFSSFGAGSPQQSFRSSPQQKQRINPFSMSGAIESQPSEVRVGAASPQRQQRVNQQPPNSPFGNYEPISPIHASPRAGQGHRMGWGVSSLQTSQDTSFGMHSQAVGGISDRSGEMPPSTYSGIAGMSMNAGESTLAGEYSITSDELQEGVERFAVYANKVMDSFVAKEIEKLMAIQQDMDEAAKKGGQVKEQMMRRAEEMKKTMIAENVAFRKHLKTMHDIYMKKFKRASHELRTGKRREVETVVTEPNKVTTEKVIEEEGGVAEPEEQAPPESEELPPPETLNGTIGLIFGNVLKEQEARKLKLKEQMEQELLINPGPETTTKYNFLKEEFVIKCKQEQETILEGYTEAARRDLEAKKGAAGPSRTTVETVDERISKGDRGEERRTTTKTTTIGSPAKTGPALSDEFYKAVDCRAQMRQQLEARQRNEIAQCGGEDITLKERHALQMEEFNMATSECLTAKFNESKTQAPDQPCTPASSRNIQFASPLCSKVSPLYRDSPYTDTDTDRSTDASTSFYSPPAASAQHQLFAIYDENANARPRVQNQPFAIYDENANARTRCPTQQQQQRPPLGELPPGGRTPGQCQSTPEKVTEITTKKICDGGSVRTEITTITTSTGEPGAQGEREGGIAICSAEPVRSTTSVSGGPCAQQRPKSVQSMPDIKCNCSPDENGCPCQSMMPSAKELCELEQLERDELTRSLRRWHIARRDVISHMADRKKAC